MEEASSTTRGSQQLAADISLLVEIDPGLILPGVPGGWKLKLDDVAVDVEDDEDDDTPSCLFLSNSNSCPMKLKLGAMFFFLNLTMSYASFSE